jgi:hypothetical protein
MSPTKIDKSKGQQEDNGASSKRKSLQEAQEVACLTQLSATLFLFQFVRTFSVVLADPSIKEK